MQTDPVRYAVTSAAHPTPRRSDALAAVNRNRIPLLCTACAATLAATANGTVYNYTAFSTAAPCLGCATTH